MNVKVASCIAPLLYEYDSVQIPGLGTLSATYASSSIDHVQGIVRPPSKKLRFDPMEEEEPDDRLTDLVAEKYNLSPEEAQEEVVNYVLDLIQRVTEKEMVSIPKVGRLYKNYKGSFQFLQDNVNFNTQAFGLPILSYYPISRELPAENKAVLSSAGTGGASAQGRQTVKNRKKARKASRVLAMMPILLLLIVGGSIAGYYLWQYASDRSELPLPVSEKRINTKPGWDDDSTDLTIEEGNEMKSVEESGTITKPGIDKPDDETPKTADNPEKTPDMPADESIDTGQETSQGELPEIDIPVKECIVIVGLFREESNVRRLSERISNYENYHIYTAPHKNMTRVGITFDCAVLDKDKELARIREDFTENAWILKQ